MKIWEETKNGASPSEQELKLSALMKRAQTGDSPAYRELLFELNSMLQKFTKKAVMKFNSSHDESHALDITQEILLAIHNKRHTYEPSQKLLPWVYGIASHKIIDWQRKRFTDRKYFDFEATLEDFEATPMTPTENHDSLSKGLESLPPKQRQAIELTKIQGKSVSEASAETGLSEANIKVLTHRGLAALKKMIGGPNGSQDE